MSIAAVPAYLGTDFSQAPPGHRFTMYLEAWQRDFSFDSRGKAKAISKMLKLPEASIKVLDALRNRQMSLAQAQGADIFDALATAPFATGLGMEHPLENGFAFLAPYGLPYLPGSGVKGVLLQAARELASGSWEDSAGWTDEAIKDLFGFSANNEAPNHKGKRGALSFWDVVPGLPGNGMRLDVMTPHHRDYFQASGTPHDSESPNPIPFLTVPSGAKFRFVVVCQEKLLQSPEIRDGAWRTLIQAAFQHAFEWLGFGAKTAVGYGAMQVDVREMEARDEARLEQQESRKRDQRIAAATSELPPDAAELKKEELKGGWTDNGVMLNAIENFLNKNAEPSEPAVQMILDLLESAWSGLTKDPDAVKGKKKKHKYSDRARKVAKQALTLRGSNI